ncbi:MAG TPA: 2-nitropropane dioxygenase [Thermoanaerobaculia bacterium]|nr:2-nitropropane dioxygenase [Thermoanaerobaculia bacterium]
MAKNFEITCPCCEATLVVDRVSGEVLLHKAKEKRGPGGTLEAMVAGLESQKTEAARRFDRQLESQKDRARILEERFKEAIERAEKSDEKFVNPFDMD